MTKPSPDEAVDRVAAGPIGGIAAPRDTGDGQCGPRREAVTAR